jgi:hypothetical protein
MNATFLPGLFMLLLTVICVALMTTGLLKALRKTNFSRRQQTRIVTVTIIVITAWMVLTGALASAGFFADFSALPPRMLLLIVVPLPIVLFIAFSKKFAVILKAVPPHWLIAMQAFRIVVELLLFRSFIAGLLPKQMTFEGGNFDILSGILAIVVAFITARKQNRVLVQLYNIVGITLLLNILVIAVLSMPTPFRVFMNGPANTLVASFPFVYLPGVLVTIAYSLHIFSLRQLKLSAGKNRVLEQKTN